MTESLREIERIDRNLARHSLGVSSMLRWFLFATLRRSVDIKIKKKLYYLIFDGNVQKTTANGSVGGGVGGFSV